MFEDARQALLSWLGRQLPPDFRIQDRPRIWHILGRNQDRAQIMGSPVRYAEVYYAPTFEAADRMFDMMGRVLITSYPFELHIYVGYEDADDRALSSQAYFEGLLEGQDGLLVALRNIPTAIGPVYLWRIVPTRIETGIIKFSDLARDAVHHVQIRLELSQI